MESNVSRPCSVSESIVNSFREVALMRAGKAEKPALEELFKNIREWVKEDSDKCTE